VCLGKNTSTTEVWLLTSLAVLLICYANEILVENKTVEQNLAKYKKKIFTIIIKLIHGEQNRMIFMIHTLMLVSKERLVMTISDWSVGNYLKISY
jgi:uncharacterized membrane protein